MDQRSKKTIEAIVIVETKYDETAPPWATAKNDSHYNYIRIYSGISDEEIGSVMFDACLMSSVDEGGEIIVKSAPETLRAFVSNEGFVLEGGLQFRENDEVRVSPGCCGGLEDWSDWFDVQNGETNIWTGHDPASTIEIDDGTVKIWDDEKTRDESPSIEFSIEEFVENLKNVEQDLNDFLLRLARWTKNIEPALEKEVVGHFAKNMYIEVWPDELFENQ